MANVYDITLKQGATWSLVITWNDSSGNPINNTGFTANMDVRDGSNNLVVNLNTTPVPGGGSITMGGLSGQITLAISSTVSSGLAVGSYYYDLFVNSPGSVDPLLEGSFVVEGRITSVV